MSSQEMPTHHRDQLLDALMHYLPMDVRGKIMREVPAAYNAWVGRDVLTVTVTSDGRVI